MMRFSMSIHGNSSYSVTIDVIEGNPSSERSTTSRTPIPGNFSRRHLTNFACVMERWGGFLRSLRSPDVHKALCSPPSAYTSLFNPDHCEGLTYSLPSSPENERNALVA